MQQVVYIASPESQQIHVWQLSSSGELSLLQVVDVRRAGTADGHRAGSAPPVCRRTP